MPKLSIIIPTFNSGRSIERCLRSIGNQSLHDYEILVQDGVSSDDTLEKIARFRQVKNSIPVAVASKKDKGPYDAMNRGVCRARGEWLYFLGSDDELHDEHVLAAMLSDRNTTDSDVLYGNVKVIGDAGWASDAAVYDGPFDLKKLLNHNICHQSVFYRRRLHRRVGKYHTPYRLCADWDFNLRCWARTEFKYIDMIVAKFHGGGLSREGVSDPAFKREIAWNVLSYFNLSVSDPLVNDSGFEGIHEIRRMQESGVSVSRILGRTRLFFKGFAGRVGDILP
jgi:glycosyltransferase involved in cell wall biosynthesis